MKCCVCNEDACAYTTENCDESIVTFYFCRTHIKKNYLSEKNFWIIE